MSSHGEAVLNVFSQSADSISTAMSAVCHLFHILVASVLIRLLLSPYFLYASIAFRNVLLDKQAQ